MKKLIPFILLIFTLFPLISCFKANDNVGYGGRCTGSANCTACSNCSGCGHCSSGGACGVCRGGSSGRSSSKSKSKKDKSSDSYKSSKPHTGKPPKVFIDKVNINLNNRYIAGTAKTNVYEKPTFKSKVITTVPKDTRLTQLSKEGSWYKVQVKSSRKVGYVFNKDVK